MGEYSFFTSIKVNDLVLPDAYIVFASRYQASGGFCNLRLKDEQYSFGNGLETELTQIYIDESELTAKSQRLKEEFVADGYTVDGVPIALDGMKTACGAELIASGPKGAVVS
jgi:hypothetical protein